MEARFFSYDHGSWSRGTEEEYVSIFSGCSRVQDSLIYLERLEEVEEEDGSIWDPYLKDDIRTFRLMLKILIPFVGCISNWQMEHRYLEVRLRPIACVLENVIQESEVFGRESIDFLGTEDLNPRSNAAGFTIFHLVKLKLVRAEMRKLYFVVSRSANPLATGIGKEAVRFINSLVETLNDILLFEADLVILLKEQIEALQDKLLFLGKFLGFLSEICIWDTILIDLLTCAEGMAVDAACVLYFILVDKMKGAEMVQENKIEILHVVDKIMPFMPNFQSGIYFLALEASRSLPAGPFVIGEYALRFFDSLIHTLRQLSNKKDDFEVALKQRIEILLEELSSVRCYIEETPSHNYKEGFDNFTAELLELIVDLGCFISSNEGLKSEEKLGNLLDKVQFTKNASGDDLIPRSWHCNFPKTNELGFIDFILMNVRERLQLNVSSTDLFKCLIDTVYEEMVALRHDFGEIADLCKENEELRDLFTHYKDVAYQVEYFVDFSLPGAESHHCQMLGLTDLRESIRQIHREFRAITTKLTSDNQFQHIADCPGDVSLESIPASIGATVHPKGRYTDKASDLIGLENEIKKIKEHIIGGPRQLQILSIVGMPGIGKTTLADSVYRDPAVTLHFHTCAWCSVSQVYQKENLLLEILLQVKKETKQDCGENDGDFDLQVYQSLKGRRYLVILDDIWDTKVWDDLRPFFPDDCNGSRVVFTTRNHDVASQANSLPHAHRLLSEKESLKLLQVKVFEEEICPAELLQVGKKIAVDCKGLPLSVVLIAGVLKMTERTQDCWEQVAKELRTYIADYASRQRLGTLELSYMHLPDYLKPCFLYFGAFPDDRKIPVQKLA